MISRNEGLHHHRNFLRRSKAGIPAKFQPSTHGLGWDTQDAKRSGPALKMHCIEYVRAQFFRLTLTRRGDDISTYERIFAWALPFPALRCAASAAAARNLLQKMWLFPCTVAVTASEHSVRRSYIGVSARSEV